MATDTITPPAGYMIEQPSAPTPPPGYTLEGSATQPSLPPSTIGPQQGTSAGDVASTIARIPTDPVGMAGDALEKLRNEIGNYTEEGKKEHPILSHIGDALNGVHELLFGGGPTLPKSGFLNNPAITAMSLAPGAADAAQGIEQAVANVKAARIAKQAQATALDANPIEATTEKVVNKVGLPKGKAAASDVSVAQDIAKQNLDAAIQQTAEGQKIQSNLQSGIRDYWNRVAKDNQVAAPGQDLSIREAGQQVGDNIIQQAKQIIKPLDDATGGKFSANDAEIRSINDKLKRVSSIDDEDKLISEKQRLLWAQDDLLKEAQKAGVPQDTLDTFKAKYRTGQAVYDQNNHLRMTTTGLPPGLTGSDADPEIVKSGTLLNRLVKDYIPEEGGTPGRLVQAGGQENANALLNSVSSAKVAESKLAATVVDKNPEFSTLPATDSSALREIVRPHVSAGKMFGTNVDYKGILDDFDKMTPAELKARFSNAPEVRNALVRAQAKQTALKVLGVAGATAAAGAAGGVGWNLAH